MRALRRSRSTPFARAVLVWFGCLTSIARTASAANPIELRNLDEPEIGLNDTTPASSIGGNSGATSGQQRLRAIEFAFARWSSALDGEMPVKVDVRFAPILPCTVGGGATVNGFILDEPGLPSKVLYPVALAEHLLQRELNDDEAEIILELNAEPCGVEWYLGLDGQAPPGQADLVSAVLHELAHGLGLTSTVDVVTGELAVDGALDVFSSLVFDDELAKFWRDLSPAELATSVARQRRLVWSGEHAQQLLALKMDRGTPTLSVQGASAEFTGMIAETDRGPWLSESIEAPLQIATPIDGCRTQPKDGVAKIVLAESGGCTLAEKAEFARRGSALALLVVSESNEAPPPSLVSDSDGESPIPVLSISRRDAEWVWGSESQIVRLDVQMDQLLGANRDGRVYIHATDPPLAGTNLSHWDALLRPSALLEAVLPRDLQFLDIALESAALADIGWTIACGNGALDPEEQCDDGAGNSDQVVDACRNDCQGPRCGDRVVDLGEECDEGRSGGVDCSASCRWVNEGHTPSDMLDAGSARDAATPDAVSVDASSGAADAGSSDAGLPASGGYSDSGSSPSQNVSGCDGEAADACTVELREGGSANAADARAPAADSSVTESEPWLDASRTGVATRADAFGGALERDASERAQPEPRAASCACRVRGGVRAPNWAGWMGSVLVLLFASRLRKGRAQFES